MNQFLTEIFEQPKALDDTLNYYLDQQGVERLNRLKDIYINDKYERIILTGMGSSFFVSHAAACLLNSLSIQAFAINTSELLYSNFSVLTENTMLVCISQSGQSVEIVKLLEKISGSSHIVGICNDDQSYLAKHSSITLLTRAGKEEMTSTKTYITTTLAAFIAGWYLSGNWSDEKIARIKETGDAIKLLLEKGIDKILRDFAFLGDITFLQFIARGPLYSAALQSELMFKEASKIAAAATLGGEFRHGPMEMVKPGFQAVLFAANGSTYEQSIKMAVDIARFNGRVILITNKDPQLNDDNIRVIFMDQPDEYLFAIQSIIPVQLMVNSAALDKGYVPGNFVHGGKVTMAE